MNILELSAPLKVTIQITNICNLRCEFCEPYGVDPNFFNKKMMMTKKEIETILDKLSEKGVARVFLSGGEPSLVPYLPDIVKYGEECNMWMCISSNGHNITKRMAKRLKNAGIRSIQISFQSGNRDIHNKIVGRSNGFDKTYQGILNAIEAGIPVQISTVGTMKNISTIKEILTLLGDKGIYKLRILRYMVFNEQMKSDLIPKKIFSNHLKEIIKLAKKFNIEYVFHSLPGVCEEVYTEYDFIHPIAITCYAGKTKMDIGVDGSVHPCRALKHKKFYCGNIFKDSVKKIWNAEPMKLMRKLTPTQYTGKCGKCHQKWGCYSARCIAFHMTGSIFGDDVSCYKLNPKLNL